MDGEPCPLQGPTVETHRATPIRARPCSVVRNHYDPLGHFVEHFS